MRDWRGTGLADWLALLAAPFIGSFLGVLVRRLPEDRPVLAARSACESCGVRLGWPDLIPLLSFLALRGRCRHCGAAIHPEHALVEVAAALIALLAYVIGLSGVALWQTCALGWALLCAAWIDARHYWLPDAIILPLVAAGPALAWLHGDTEATTAGAIGAMLGYTSFRLLGAGYSRLRGRDGLGQGDAKLLAAGGAWLGWQGLADTVLAGATFGLILAAALRLRGQSMTRSTALPFGPPLALAIWGLWLLSAWRETAWPD